MSNRSDDDPASEDETLQALSEKNVLSAADESEEEAEDGDNEDDVEYLETEPSGSSSFELTTTEQELATTEQFEEERATSPTTPAMVSGKMYHSRVAFARRPSVGKRKRNEKMGAFYSPPPPHEAARVSNSPNSHHHKNTYRNNTANAAATAVTVVAASSSSAPTHYLPTPGRPPMPLVFPRTAFEDNVRITLTGAPDYYHILENAMTPPLDSYGRIQVQSGDVLCGRGGATKKHPGNIRFRELIAHLRSEYLQTSKNHKTIISKLLVMAIRQTKVPSRFLKKNQNDEWMDIGDKRAWEKVSQAFREQWIDYKGNPGIKPILSKLC